MPVVDSSQSSASLRRIIVEGTFKYPRSLGYRDFLSSVLTLRIEYYDVVAPSAGINAAPEVALLVQGQNHD